MSVYDEICNWIIDDIVDGIDTGLFEEDDLDALLDDVIQDNLDDLSESIWARQGDMYRSIKKKLKEMKE